MISKHESHSAIGRRLASGMLVLAALVVGSTAFGQDNARTKKVPGKPERAPTTLQRADDSSPASHSTARCIGLVVESADALRRPGSEPRFRATDVIDIAVSLRLTQRGLTDNVARFRFYTPNGHLYEQIDVPFAANADARSQRRLPGYPHPVAVARAQEQSINGNVHFEVPVSLPVAGTLIVNNSLYGRWTVEASLGDDSGTCVGAVDFYILQ